ncbi:MAG: nucleotidyltransferase domain-containing protein [Clostridia bacterium]|nr:nucleotidyltransferase domain-containing protein [Clostridia bacterium]
MRKPYTKEELSALLKNVFEKNGIKKAIVFGSYATGCAKCRSDIDMCVETDLRGLAFIDFIEDVRRALKIDPDIVRASEVVKDSRLEKEIIKDGVVIYER